MILREIKIFKGLGIKIDNDVSRVEYHTVSEVKVGSYAILKDEETNKGEDILILLVEPSQGIGIQETDEDVNLLRAKSGPVFKAIIQDQIHQAEEDGYDKMVIFYASMKKSFCSTGGIDHVILFNDFERSTLKNHGAIDLIKTHKKTELKSFSYQRVIDDLKKEKCIESKTKIHSIKEDSNISSIMNDIIKGA